MFRKFGNGYLAIGAVNFDLQKLKKTNFLYKYVFLLSNGKDFDYFIEYLGSPNLNRELNLTLYKAGNS
jgi:hypothetical protein